MELKDLLKPNIKQKIIISSIIFLLVIIAIIYFVVLPTIKEIKNIRNEIEAQRIDLENKYIKGQSIKKLAQSIEQIEPKLGLLDQAFISQNSELEFITTLEKAADKSGVSQKINLTHPTANANSSYEKMALQLFSQGSFLNQYQYLNALESSSYYININSLEITSAPATAVATDKTSGRNVNFMISAATFWK